MAAECKFQNYSCQKLFKKNGLLIIFLEIYKIFLVQLEQIAVVLAH